MSMRTDETYTVIAHQTETGRTKVMARNVGAFRAARVAKLVDSLSGFTSETVKA